MKTAKTAPTLCSPLLRAVARQPQRSKPTATCRPNRRFWLAPAAVAAGLPLLLAASAVSPLLLCARPALAQDAPGDVESARNSSLLPGLTLPEGAYRSTSRADIATFADTLGKLAQQSEGSIARVEVFIWRGGGDGPRKTLLAALSKAGYKLNERPALKEDFGTITLFGAAKAVRTNNVLGMWVAQKDYLLLAWGAFVPDNGGAAVTPAPETKTDADGKEEPAPAPASAANSAGNADTSSLTGAVLPRGAARFDVVSPQFSSYLRAVAAEKAVSLTPTSDRDAAEVFVWRGLAPRRDRVAFAKTALNNALGAAGYEVKEIPYTDLRDSNVYEHFRSDDKSLPLRPDKTPAYFRATNDAQGKALIGTWIQSADDLAVGLLPVAYKAPKKPAPLPAASNAHVITDLNNPTKELPAPAPPAFPAMAPKPGTVRGVALDYAGRPLAGVEVAVYSSAGGGFRTTHKARTNAKGVYEVLVPTGICEVAEASATVSYNGAEYKLRLGSARPGGEFSQFDSRKGHVENLVLRTTGKEGGTLRVLDNLDSGTIEVTLTPVGKLLDGSTGGAFVYRYDAGKSSETFLNSLPLGRYKLTARLLDDGEALPLRAGRTFGSDAERAPGPSLQVDFTPGYTFSQVNSGKSNHDVQFFDVTLEP